MEHEITFRFTEEEYVTLKVKSEKTGQEIEALIHELVDELRAREMQLTPPSSHPISTQEALKRLYQKGVFASIPSGEPFSKEDEIELERLGNLFSQAGGKPASEMVIEDRGPY